ncbi:MAG: hypothetical protein ACR2PX_04755 [Endozoicomonas sp.]
MGSTALFGASHTLTPAPPEQHNVSMKFEATVELTNHTRVHASKIELGTEKCRPMTSSQESQLHFAENALNPATLSDYKSKYLSDQYEICTPSSLWVTEKANLITQDFIYLGQYSQILLHQGTLTPPPGSFIALRPTLKASFPRIVMESCSTIQAEWINIRITAQDNQWLPPASKTVLLKAIHSPFCEEITPDFRIASSLTQKWSIETRQSDSTEFIAVREDIPFLYSQAASPSLQKEAEFIDMELRREASENPGSNAAQALAKLDRISEQNQYDEAVRELIARRQQN